MTTVTIESAHDTILTTAAAIANRKYRDLTNPSEPTYLPGERFNIDARKRRGGLVIGDVFRADGGRSEKGGMCLSVDESIVKGRTAEEIEEIHRIGREAIKEAVTTTHRDLFAGLIMGELRHGRNYFDRYKTDDDQLRLL